MLFLLLAWVYIFLLSMAYGLLAVNLLSKFKCISKPAGTSAPEILSLAGFCLLSWLLSLLHFTTTINGWGHAILGTGALLSLFLNFNNLRQSLQHFRSSLCKPVYFWVLFLGFAIFTLLQAVQTPAFPDTGGYHAQFIQWLQQFRIVPGLGNLHGRLAFNSHVHLLAAFFSLPETAGWPLHQAFGSFLFVLSSCFALRQLFMHINQKSRYALFYCGFLLLLFSCFRPWLSSPMPDSAVAVFTFFLSAILLEKLRQSNLQESDLNSGILLLLLATLISFKLSAVFLVSLLVFQFWHLHAGRRLRYFLTAIGIFSLILLPWLCRNVVLSGYLVYPLPGLDLFNFDWEIPVAQVRWEQLEIVHFARRPDALWRENMGVAFPDWVNFWFQQQDRISRLLFFGFLALLLFPGLLLARRNLKQQPSLYLLFLAFSLSCGLWFFTAPAFRFAYGYLISAVLTGVLLLLPNNLSRKLLYFLPVLCFAYAANGIRSALKTPELNLAILRPLPYIQVITLSEKVSNHPVLVRPGDGRCWNEPIPCTYQIGPGLQLRGNSLQDGFRIGQNSLNKTERKPKL